MGGHGRHDLDHEQTLGRYPGTEQGTGDDAGARAEFDHRFVRRVADVVDDALAEGSGGGYHRAHPQRIGAPMAKEQRRARISNNSVINRRLVFVGADLDEIGHGGVIS